MTRRTTIEDVAKLAKVGKVTVSYVLNGRAEQVRISTTTKERVLDAARQLDYRPNALARMLVRQRTDTIGVVFQYAEYFSQPSSFINDVMSGVTGACVEQELDVLLHTKPALNPLAEANALSDGRVDGALILRDSGDPVVSSLLDRKMPVVLFFSRSEDPLVPHVDCDNYAGGQLAANHLCDLGHKRLAMVTGSENSNDARERLKGFRDGVRQRGQKFDESNTVQIFRPTTAMDGFKQMMSRPDRPTGVFVWSDDVAFRCMDVCAELSLNIPDDLSLIGFDSSQACDRVSPPLTSVRQPIVEMAAAATTMLAHLLKGKELEVPQLVFPLDLTVRASTAPPKTS